MIFELIDIPDILLEAQELGELVVFVRAGVSRGKPSKLPDFDGRAKGIAKGHSMAAKQGQDMLVWLNRKEQFPPLLLLRRYMKIVARHCERLELLDLPMDDPRCGGLPFDLSLLPRKFPPLSELRLWSTPIGEFRKSSCRIE